MDFNITCDDFEDFQPTAEDFENDEVLWEVEPEEDEDLSELLGSFNADFFGLVDSMNNYKI